MCDCAFDYYYDNALFNEGNVYCKYVIFLWGFASHEWARVSELVGHARALARTWCTNRCWALPCSDSCGCVCIAHDATGKWEDTNFVFV